MSEKEYTEEEIYIAEMKSWFKEQDSRRKNLVEQIESSTEIARQNKIQLEWHDIKVAKAKKEFEEWKAEYNG